MHAPPSVSYPVGRSGFAGGLLGLAALAGAATLAAWALQAPAGGWRLPLAFLLFAACAAFAAAGWWRSPAGVLRWDGAGWSWEHASASESGRPEIALDLQSRLLVRWRPEAGRARWLWAERKSEMADWDALRRAIYSRASTSPVPPSGTPPAAEQ